MEQLLNDPQIEVFYKDTSPKDISMVGKNWPK